jgi:transposase
MELEKLEINDFRHLGLIAGALKSINFSKIVDDAIGVDSEEKVTTGECASALIINFLGEVSKPLYLIPEFFDNKPIEMLIRPGISAKELNGTKLGRSLDKIYKYGCSKLVSLVALNVCKQEGVDPSLIERIDTTSWSLYGDYEQELIEVAKDNKEDPTRAQPAIPKQGYAKNKRFDLNQVIVSLAMAGNSGFPTHFKLDSGNASDVTIFHNRAKEIYELIKMSDLKPCIVADCKLYAPDAISYLKLMAFITRVPSNATEKALVIQALQKPADWHSIVDCDNNETYKFQAFNIEYYGFEHRWIVFYSHQARNRAQETVNRHVMDEAEEFKSTLFHLQSKRFACEADAILAFTKIKEKLKYHSVQSSTITEYKKYEKPGKPGKDAKFDILYQIKAELVVNQPFIDQQIEEDACFVLAAHNVDSKTPQQILQEYKGLDSVEKGIEFLKSKTFFTNAIFLKSLPRIEAFFALMVLALLVYMVIQRRIRRGLAINNATIPNQIKKQTATPTARYVFQLFEGVSCLKIALENGTFEYMVKGLTPLAKKILQLCGPETMCMYQFTPSMIESSFAAN